MTVVRAVVVGALAGAAGTTALHAATYADMAVRARPASRTPQDSVERLAEFAHVRIPGAGDARENRLTGLGALGGIATGVAFGALYGVSRELGLRPPAWAGALGVAAAAMLGANGPMTLLRISDPRSWSAGDWMADVLPHLAYGAATAATYAAAETRAASIGSKLAVSSRI